MTVGGNERSSRIMVRGDGQVHRRPEPVCFGVGAIEKGEGALAT